MYLKEILQTIGHSYLPLKNQHTSLIKMFTKNWGEGRILLTPCNFRFCYVIETKLGTMIELCIFYPKTKELVF